MRLDEPAKPVAVVPACSPDLLVGDDDQNEVTGGDEALALERGEGDRRRGHLPLHVERTAPPDLTVDQVAGPRIAIPFGRVGENRVRM